MTPLIREMVKLVIDADLDPTQTHWFDLTGVIKDHHVAADPKRYLLHPAPYKKVMLCGHTAHGDFLLLIITEPAATIVTGWILKTTGYKSLGSFLFAEHDGEPKMGPVDKPIDSQDQAMMAGLVAMFYSSLDTRTEAFVPTLRNTFTNRRKVRQGKLPSYDWHTVVVEPSKPQQEHQGGTHASPRRHQARGHWRTYKSGKRGWVKENWRGDASKGTVFKDYFLKEKNT